MKLFMKYINGASVILGSMRICFLSK